MLHGFADREWLPQGGYETIASYEGVAVSEAHLKYMRTALSYYVDDHNRLFVHAGIIPHTPLESHALETLVWDRSLWYMVKDMAPDHENVTQFDRVFIGHTATTAFGTMDPMRGAEVWNLDTGCGWHGRLTIMDVDTEEYWQSDPSPLLYPGVRGRS